MTSAFPLEEYSRLVGSAPNESGSDEARPATGLPVKEYRVIHGLLNCILSGAVTSPSTASIAGVPEKAMFFPLPLPPVVYAVRISGVCRWKGTGLRPEDPGLGRESIPVGPSEYLAGKRWPRRDGTDTRTFEWIYSRQGSTNTIDMDDGLWGRQMHSQGGRSERTPGCYGGQVRKRNVNHKKRMTQPRMTSSGGAIYCILAGVFSRKRPLSIWITEWFEWFAPGYSPIRFEP